jgi:hypothetical protein
MEASVHVILARRNGMLAGVLPLVINRRFGLVEFATVWNDYNDIIAVNGDWEVIRGLLGYAFRNSPTGKRMVLERLRHDSNCYRALRTLFSKSQLKKHFVEEPIKYFYVPLSCAYDDHLAILGKKFRKNLLLVRHKAETAVAIRELYPASFIPTEVPEIFLSLHLARFGTRTPFAQAGDQAFLRCLLTKLFLSGAMRSLFSWRKKGSSPFLCVWLARKVFVCGMGVLRWKPNPGLQGRYSLMPDCAVHAMKGWQNTILCAVLKPTSKNGSGTSAVWVPSSYARTRKPFTGVASE